MEKRPITALLDANVLYPVPVRDLLLHLADFGLYYPKWSEQIHNEWIKNLLINRPDLKLSSLKAAQKAMNLAFPDADVKGYIKAVQMLSGAICYLIFMPIKKSRGSIRRASP